MCLSVCKIDGSTNKMIHLYDGIETPEEACLLAQLAMVEKPSAFDLIVILPGWNRDIHKYHKDEYEKALRLANEYKVIARDSVPINSRLGEPESLSSVNQIIDNIVDKKLKEIRGGKW